MSDGTDHFGLPGLGCSLFRLAAMMAAGHIAGRANCVFVSGIEQIADLVSGDPPRVDSRIED